MDEKALPEQYRKAFDVARSPDEPLMPQGVCRLLGNRAQPRFRGLAQRKGARPRIELKSLAHRLTRYPRSKPRWPLRRARRQRWRRWNALFLDTSCCVPPPGGGTDAAGATSANIAKVYVCTFPDSN